MPHSQPDYQRRLEYLGRRIDAVGAGRDSSIADYHACLEDEPSNDEVAEALGYMIDEFEDEQSRNPNYLASPPLEEDLFPPGAKPDFPVGITTETGVVYGPRISSDCGSVMVTGISGGGKTTLIQNTVLGVHRHLPQATVLIFDVKGDHTCFASLLEPNVHVYRVHDELRLHLLRPPAGVALDAWLATVATFFCEYRGLKKSRHMLLDVFKRLCRHFGVDQDPGKPWPSLFNVLDYLKQMRTARFGKEAEYKTSLVNELQGFLDDTGRIFDTSDGVDLHDHLLAQGGIVVLQIDSLPVSAQQLIISLGVERVIQTQKAKNVHNSQLAVLIVLDEAQLVLSQAADRVSENGVAPLAVHLLRARETGVGFIVAPHLLPDISRSVLAAAKTMFVVGGLSDSMSIDIAGRMMNLPPRASTMIPRLGGGQALAREIGKGNSYTDAFLVDLDPPVLAKDAIDEATRRQVMAPKLAAFPATPSTPINAYPSIMAELYPVRNATQPASPTASARQTLTKEQMDLLLDCARSWDEWMLHRPPRMKLDYKSFETLAQSLEAQGLVKIHRLRLNSYTYGLIEVTDNGWKAIQQAKPQGYIGHGGFVHTVLIRKVCRYLNAQGWLNVQAEFRIGQNLHPVDVYGRSPAGIPTAFEVTLSTSNVVSNALNSLAVPGGVPELVFLCLLDTDRKAVTKLLQQDPRLASYMPHIQVARVRHFIS